MTFDDNDFRTFRRYSRHDAAALLHIPDSWLRGWVTDDAVPHQRSGKPGPRQRGVWFTYDDILAIGKMMPSLTTTRRANSRAEGHVGNTPGGQPHVADSACDSGDGLVVPCANTVSGEEWQEFGGLTSLRA